MVSMDECGYIYVYGRMSNAQRWKVASNVIYSISIETVLLKNPYIRSAVVSSSSHLILFYNCGFIVCRQQVETIFI